MDESNFIKNPHVFPSSSRIIIMTVHIDDEGDEVRKELVWNKIKIRKSLDEICHSMELELPGSERNKIDKHDKVEVRLFSLSIGEEEESLYTRRLTTVLVDEINERYDAQKSTVIVIGRSPARDIIDSTWGDMILHQQSLETVVKTIAQKFGIRVHRESIGSPPTGTVYSFSWENESPWTKIIAKADEQGFIFTSNEKGDLYLWKVAINERDEGKKNKGDKSFFFLSETQNIRNIQIIRNGAEQFHEYVVRGYGLEGRVYDAKCKNNRVWTINVTDGYISQDDLERRALTEKRRRQGNRIAVTISGWGLTDKQIKELGITKGKEIFWNPNFFVPVYFPSLKLTGHFLISETEYEADSTTMISRITLVDREVYT
jgi:prophage tail gpP-like protein